MTTSIKEYKQIYILKSYDSEIDIIPDDIDKLLDDLNDKSHPFMKIGAGIMAKSQIKSILPFEPSDDIEDYISQMPRGEAKKFCKQLYQDRKEKHFVTSSVESLLTIAKNKRPELF